MLNCPASCDAYRQARIHHSFSIDLSIWDANQGGVKHGPEATVAVVEDRTGATTRSCAQSGESGQDRTLDTRSLAVHVRVDALQGLPELRTHSVFATPPR